MRKVLILAYYFPPIVASGSHRPAGFCAHLGSLDYEPIILTTNDKNVHPPIATDNSLLNLVPAGVKVYPLTYRSWQKTLLHFRDRIQKSANEASATFGENTIDEPGTTNANPSLKSAFLNRIFRFPDQQGAWGRAAVAFARELPTEEKPDIVFATANPWSALVAGEKIGRMLDIPFVADFRDPWSDNPKPPLSKSLGVKAAKLEKKIISKASGVIANTEELAESFRNKYPQDARKITTITNGFSHVLRAELSNLPSYSAKNARGVELCYFGAVYELRRPTEILLALKELLEEGCPGADKLRIRFTGGWIVQDRQCNALAEELELRGAVIRENSLPHKEYLAGLKAAQYLLLLQQGFPLQIPAKIYEYMASGRPMIMIGGEGATANLIRKTGIGQVCPNDIRSIKSMLNELLITGNEASQPVTSAVERFSYESLCRKLTSFFDDVIERHV